MKNSYGIFCWGICVLLGLVQAVPAAEEHDLSNVSLEVEHKQLLDNTWEYRYVLVNGSMDTELRSLFIDISCPDGTDIVPQNDAGDQSEGYLDPAKFPEIERLRKGVHVPVKISAAYGAAAYWGVTTGNEAFWGTLTKPGNTSNGLVIVSKGMPILRNFRVAPMFRPSLEEDDYAEGEWEDENDYTLYGMIIGPSCEESTDVPMPDEPEEQGPGDAVFEGTPPFGQVGINYVLTYTEPLQSQFAVPASQTSIAMTVHYAATMDPESFKVEPGWARELFKPVPGSSETVMLPLKPGLNPFRLEATMVEDEKPEWRQTRDLDVFAIRRGKMPPGQEKKQ